MEVSALSEDFREIAWGLARPDDCSALYEAPRLGVEAVFMPVLSDGRGLARLRRGGRLDDIFGAIYLRSKNNNTNTPDAVTRSVP